MSYIGNQPAPTNIPVSNLDGVTSTNTELNFVDGVTSNVQTQLNAKQPYATIAVTVVDSGGNKYALDGTVQQLGLLTPSVTYRFDQSDSSNSGHPLLLSTTSNGTHGGGSAFTTGVTAVGTPGSAGAYTEVKLEQDAPDTLYYYCSSHSGMGGQIDSKATVSSLTDLGVTATTAELNYLDIATLGLTAASKAVTADANGVTTFDNGTIEESTSVTSGSNAATLNLRDGNVFEHTLTENVTYTFSNPASSGKVSSFVLKIKQDASGSGYTVTFPASVDFVGGTAPTLTATANAIDTFVIFTTDGGTIYNLLVAGQDIK